MQNPPLAPAKTLGFLFISSKRQTRGQTSKPKTLGTFNHGSILAAHLKRISAISAFGPTY